jgi:hypothetical protein
MGQRQTALSTAALTALAWPELPKFKTEPKTQAGERRTL